MSESRPAALPTLRELLRRPAFQGAELLAGRAGLDVPVRWVHVGEIPDIARYLRGQELILSTGVGLRQPHDRRRYLERLADCRVAGVCIELGRYLRSIPDDMLRLADRLALPLVTFPTPVRFVDITRDVHSLILQGEQQALVSLQQLAEDLRRLQGALPSEEEIFARLGLWLGDAAVLLPAAGKTLSSGPPERAGALAEMSETLLRELRDGRATVRDAALGDGSAVVSRLIAQQDGKHGLLAAACAGDGRVAAGMALDLAAAALAQAPRLPQPADAAAGDDDLVVARLLSGQEPPGLLSDDLGRFRRIGRLPAEASLLLLRGPGAAPAELAAELRRHLAASELAALVGVHRGDVAMLLFDPLALAQVRRLADDLRRVAEVPGSATSLQIGVSTRLPLGDLPRCVGQAGLALDAGLWSQGETSFLYEELGALKMLANVRDGFDLARLVEEEIGPLLAYDRRHGTELVRSLAVLLQCDQKEEAARRLRIRRQTLYYRIDRIRALLGEDFLRPHRRPGLMLALLARLQIERTELDTV